MSKAAELSYTSKTGYYGLRVNETLEEAMGTIRKPLRIPLPDRKAKWYALSPYRALILDAEKKYNNYEHAAIDYRESGAALPEAAARVRPSNAGGDPTFAAYDEHKVAMDHQQAYEIAHAAMKEGHRRETAEIRRQQLMAIHHPNDMDPTIQAAHDELEEAGVPHRVALPGAAPLKRGYTAPTEQMVSAGQPQAPEFPPFEVLNQGQPANVRQATLRIDQNLTYERMRDFVPGLTWSS